MSEVSEYLERMARGVNALRFDDGWPSCMPHVSAEIICASQEDQKRIEAARAVSQADGYAESYPNGCPIIPESNE